MNIRLSNHLLWLYDKTNKNLIQETRVWRLNLFKQQFVIWKTKTGRTANYTGLLEIGTSGHYKNRPLGHIVMFSEDFIAKLYRIDDRGK